MAARETKSGANANPDSDVARVSPLRAQLVLLGGFVIVLVLSILTVLMPEIADDRDSEQSESGARAHSDSRDSTP